MGDKTWYALAASVAVVVGVLAVTVIPANLVGTAVVVAVVGALVWLCRLGWWRATYVITLALMVGAVSNIPPLIAAAEYLRYAAAGALLAVTWVTTRKTEPEYRSKLQRRFVKALWFTVALAAASVVWSVSRFDTIAQTLALIFLIGTLHLVTTRRWTDRATMMGDFRAGVALLNIAFVASLATLFIGYEPAHTIVGNRFQGIFNNPNLLGIIATVTIPVIWGLFLAKRVPIRFLMVIPAVSALLLTESRTAIAGVIIGFAVVIARSSAVVKVALGIVGVLAWIFSLAANINPFGDVFERFGSIEGGGALNGRALAWTEAWQLILEQPLGYGWQAGRQLFELLIGSSDFQFTRTSVHNSYLQFLLELGLLGLIPLLYLFFAVFGLIVLRGENDKFSAGLVGSVAAGAVVQFTESAMFGTGQPYPYIFWFAVAGALTVYTSRDTETKDPAAQKRKSLPDAYKRMKFPVSTH